MFKAEHKDNYKIMQHTADCLETAYNNIQTAVKRLDIDIARPLRMAGDEIQRMIKEIDNHVANLPTHTEA